MLGAPFKNCLRIPEAVEIVPLFTPSPCPSPKGRGDYSPLLVGSLSLWERVGVRALHIQPPRNRATIFATPRVLKQLLNPPAIFACAFRTLGSRLSRSVRLAGNGLWRPPIVSRADSDDWKGKWATGPLLGKEWLNIQ